MVWVGRDHDTVGGDVGVMDVEARGTSRAARRADCNSPQPRPTRGGERTMPLAKAVVATRSSAGVERDPARLHRTAPSPGRRVQRRGRGWGHGDGWEARTRPARARGAAGVRRERANADLPLRAVRRRTDFTAVPGISGDGRPACTTSPPCSPDGTAWNPPELYSLKVHPGPSADVARPPARRTRARSSSRPQPPPRVTVEALAGDDYGDGRGAPRRHGGQGFTGEAVKFREQAFSFDADAPADAAAPHGRRLTRTLDLGALGMEPGDELYFFVEARDNRQPTPNRTRSETRFIVLRGPEEKSASQRAKASRASTSSRRTSAANARSSSTREKLLADRPAIC